ncbi:MAG TPA: DNA-directed RNA polymerase subunit beta, partial [Gallicola sp.]|nr:DNA-directed RNA polymerase subunit beta [Gallicola sp.]
MHKEQYGITERMSYSRIQKVLDLPNLIAVQKNSYDWFLEEGLREVFDDISPISDYAGSLVLEFVDYYLEETPKYSEVEAKDRDANYSCPLKVKVRLINKETEEVKEQEVFMGDFPMMTNSGTFIINGAERVIVSQLVRSPGVYYGEEIDKSGNKLYSSTVIPNRGAWLEYDTDANGVISVRIDRTRKLPVTTLLRALIYPTDEEIIEALGDTKELRATLEKEVSNTREEALLEIYRKLKPGDPAAIESAEPLINNLFFDSRRYDLAKVGRYKFNKKLSLVDRIVGTHAAYDVVNEETGEILVSEGEFINNEIAKSIEDAGIYFLDVIKDENKVRVISNRFVDLDAFDIDFDISDLKLSEKVYYPKMKEILETYDSEEEIRNAIKENYNTLSPIHITPQDILASISYEFNLFYGVGKVDDIDHLGNRRVRAVGELLQNQFRIGLSRMERVVKERMSTQDPDLATPQALINIRPVVASIKEFFGSSQLSQFMDQTNPLAELTHKRRMSALGPGGLSRDRAGAEVRDVHDTHYGRICPIETPEGPNIGLITSMTTYASLNEYGFLQTPYRKVENGVVTDRIDLLTADLEDTFIIAQANEPLDENGVFVNERVLGRGYNGENDIYPREKVDYMDVSPQQIVSVGTAMIPFLENDDATRALMGSNMQRQAVPLLKTDAPIIGTGIEHKAAKDSGVVVISNCNGVVTKVASNEIQITRDEDKRVERYKILKFKRSNQGTAFNQRPIVKVGERVSVGDIIADGPSTENGEIALGKNILIAFMTW